MLSQMLTNTCMRFAVQDCFQAWRCRRFHVCCWHENGNYSTIVHSVSLATLIAGSNTSGVGSWRQLSVCDMRLLQDFPGSTSSKRKSCSILITQTLICVQEPTAQVLVPAINMMGLFCHMTKFMDQIMLAVETCPGIVWRKRPTLRQKRPNID